MDNRQTNQPQWLIDTQNKSWEPELLISGISLVFIFSFTNEIMEFAIRLTQVTTTHPILIMTATMYVSMAIIALKWTFGFHLLFRGIWVGMVGLSYVFPKGIKFEKLQKMQQAEYVTKEFDQPIDMVLLLEKICSTIFSLAFMAVGISFFILGFLFITLILNLFGIPIFWSFIIVLIIMVLGSIVVPINHYYHKKYKRYIPLLIRIHRIFQRVIKYTFYREPLMTFQTNINQVTTIVFFMLFFIFLGMQTGAQLGSTVDFFAHLTPGGYLRKLNNEDKVKPERLFPLNYRDQSNERVHRAQVPTAYVEGDLLELFVADYRWDRRVFDRVNQDTTRIYTIEPLVNIYLDSTKMGSQSWFRTNHRQTGQRGWLTHIDLESVQEGRHNIRIDKTTWDYLEKEIIVYEDWSEIVFWVK